MPGGGVQGAGSRAPRQAGAGGRRRPRFLVLICPQGALLPQALSSRAAPTPTVWNRGRLCLWNQKIKSESVKDGRTPCGGQGGVKRPREGADPHSSVARPSRGAPGAVRETPQGQTAPRGGHGTNTLFVCFLKSQTEAFLYWFLFSRGVTCRRGMRGWGRASGSLLTAVAGRSRIRSERCARRQPSPWPLHLSLRGLRTQPKPLFVLSHTGRFPGLWSSCPYGEQRACTDTRKPVV